MRTILTIDEDEGAARVANQEALKYFNTAKKNIGPLTNAFEYVSFATSSECQCLGYGKQFMNLGLELADRYRLTTFGDAPEHGLVLYLKLGF